MRAADLVEDFGIYQGPSPTKDSPGWTKPTRIVVPSLMPAKLLELKRIAPEVMFIPVKTIEDAAREASNADAVLGFCSADIVKAGKKLRWIQVGHAGVENDLVPEVVASNLVLTNTQRLYGPSVADQGMALLLALTRGLAPQLRHRPLAPGGTGDVWSTWKKESKTEELHGKTMLVVGLGGVGTEIARRARGFGMQVMAVDPNPALERPAFVFSLGHPKELAQLLPKADVVVLSCPLTRETQGMFGAKQFAAMKSSAYFINVARGGLVQTPDLVAALTKGQIAGAGLDVTDPEPIPDNDPLWRQPNVVISPHLGGQSTGNRDRQWRLYRENVRRFVAGEPLLCVVDKQKGY